MSAPGAFKVSLTPQPAVWTMTIGTKRFPNLRQVGKWEGLIKLEADAGVLILQPVSPRDSFSELLGPILRMEQEARSEEWLVVRASPIFIEAMVAAKVAADAAATAAEIAGTAQAPEPGHG